LPPGLLFSAGSITGTPRLAGRWAVQIKGFNGASIVRSAQLPIQVAPLSAGLIGVFSGIVAKNAELNDNLASRIDCVIGSSGVVSGRLIGSRGRATFIGNLKTTASNPLEASLSVPVSALRAGENFQLDLLFNGSSKRFSGTLAQRASGVNSQNLSTADISGWRNSWGRFQAVDYAGNYRFYLSADSNQADIPQGYGYGGAFVSRETGAVSMWGSLSDAHAISSSCALSPSGEILAYSLLYGGSGSCVGLVSLAKGATPAVDNTVLGSLNWTKQGWGKRGPKVSPQNFEASIQAQGRIFSPAKSRLLHLASARSSVSVQLSIGSAEWIHQPLSLQASGGLQIRAAIPWNSYAFGMQPIEKQSGFFSGGFQFPSASPQGLKREASFSGQIVNTIEDSTGYGFFLAPKEPEAGGQLDPSILYSGKVILQVP
jgi:hypothetical protein